MMDEQHKKYNDHPVYKRIRRSGPKRILSLDGGGIRGALTLGYLEQIEQILRDRYDDKGFVLADYFDLVGGTSTGSILATLIALGWPIENIKELYFELGKKIFTKRSNILIRWHFKYLFSAEYDHRPLEKALEDKLQNTTLGHTDLKTGLAIFAKRADTYSIYKFHNNPLNAYYEENKGLLLKDLVRASCAAPSYFKPHPIQLKDNETAVFIDGGVSLVNNPSLSLFEMATISGYKYEWPMGADNLQIISIGTGYGKDKVQGKELSKLKNRKSILWASELSDIFMIDATEQSQLLLQYFSNPHRPQYLNREAKDLKGDLITKEPLLDYCRYDISLDPITLNSFLINKTPKEILHLRKMDNGENAQILFNIGQKAAEDQVEEGHFRPEFDFGQDDLKDIVLSQEDAINTFLPHILKKGNRYKKFKNITARIVKHSEEVITITSDGIETKNIAEDQDYIVQNQTSSKEQYVIKKKAFKKRYKLAREIDDQWSEYSPKGKIQAIQVSHALSNELELTPHFHIIASWKESMYVNEGDFLVTPKNQTENLSYWGKRVS